MFRLIRFPPYCEGIHRSGWPYVHQHLQEYAVGDADEPDAPLLDDFVDASFGYRPVREPHSSPWVGIFHHPVNIDSPLTSDRSLGLKRINLNRKFRNSRKWLRGAIVMAPALVPVIKEWLGVPVLCLRHPTDEMVEQWDADAYFSRPPRLFQAGFFLRDTRFVFHLDLPRYEKSRSAPYMTWAVSRDKKLMMHFRMARSGAPPVSAQGVEELPRLSDPEYDKRLASSVVVTRLFGAAANNVVVECVARRSPIVINRLPEVEYYLGAGYPLFFKNSEPYDDAQRLLRDDARIRAAHDYLVEELDTTWLDASAFAAQVAQFVEQVTR